MKKAIFHACANWRKQIVAGILSGVFLAVGIRAEEPDLRVGIFTDTHIGKTEESCLLSRKAFELFKKYNVDMVVHLGDLANNHYPEGYKIYRRFFNEVFGDRKPREIYIYANHDRIGIKTKAGFHVDMQKFKDALNIQNEICDKLVVKGYPFLIYPDFPGYSMEKKMTADIREMIKAHPGKPVFIMDHVPADGTNYRKRVFDQFPQVIHFAGHAHKTLRNELCIWQGNFTEVSAGCLDTWRGTLIGNAPSSKKSDEVLVMDVFPRKILLRRYSVTDGSEIRPDNPWCIPWPFDPKNAPYNLAFRKAHSPAPKFPDGAKITVSAKGNPFREMEFSFPEAFHPEGIYRYSILLEKKMPSGKFEIVMQKEEFGQFYLKETQRQPTEKVSISAGVFVPNENYRITVSPQNFYGTLGTPLRQEFKTGVPERGKIVFESDNPAKDCVYMTGKTVLKPEDGFFRYPGGGDKNHAQLIFPKGIWDGPKGTHFRVIIDMAVEQPQNARCSLVLRSVKTGLNPHGRIYTPPGKTSNFLICVDIKKMTRKDSYFLLIRKGLPGKFAFHSVRIEKFE